MTKRERAIIMAYAGGVTFTKDDIGYFLEYVKEKTGIELEVVGWSVSGVPDIYFGSTKKEIDETVNKIRKACKKDFDDLIRSSNEEENKKSERDKNSKIFFEKLKRLEQILERELRVDEVLLLAIFYSLEIVKSGEEAVFAGTSAKVSISLRTCISASNYDESEDEDAEKFIKKMRALEQLLGRDFRHDEVALLAMFEAIDITKADEKKEEKQKIKHGKEVENLFITLAFLEAILGKNPFEHLPSQVKHMDECCCDKKEEEK